MHWTSYFAGSASMAVILVVVVLVWLVTVRKSNILESERKRMEYDDAALNQLIERTGLEAEQNRILTRLVEVVLLASREGTKECS